MNASMPSTEAVWSRFSSDLWKFIRKRVADDHTADDLLQDAFVRIHQSLDTVANTESLPAWVYKLARNVIHDHYRRASGDSAALPEIASEGLEQDCLCGKTEGLMDEMIRQLPEDYRMAIQLSEIEGLPQQEVASRLGLSLSGAKSRIQRGRKLLKEVLEACCAFDLDRRGNVIDYEPKPDRKVCLDCPE